MTIIKDDIIHNVITKTKIDRNIAKILVETILRLIKETLASSNRIMISGFGDFKVVHKKARIGRNPKTLVTYEISERNVVVFSPSKVLRKEMNQGSRKVSWLIRDAVTGARIILSQSNNHIELKCILPDQFPLHLCNFRIIDT